MSDKQKAVAILAFAIGWVLFLSVIIYRQGFVAVPLLCPKNTQTIIEYSDYIDGGRGFSMTSVKCDGKLWLFERKPL